MASEPRRVETELINPWLGHRPFALVELSAEQNALAMFGDDDDGDYSVDIHMTVRYGGGIGKSGAMGTLAAVLEENGWQVTPPDGFDPDAED